MSAKEEMVVQIESAKEKIAEGMAEMVAVVARLGETQETVAAVMGEENENFGHAKQLLEESHDTLLGIGDTLDEVIESINGAS